jgi:hypothetical protein
MALPAGIQTLQNVEASAFIKQLQHRTKLQQSLIAQRLMGIDLHF